MAIDVTSAVQSTFDAVYPIGQEGTLFSFQDELDALDAGSGHAGADLSFGRVVCSAAATPNLMVVPTSAGDVARACGVTLRSDYVGSGSAGYRSGQNVHTVRKGWVWMSSLEGVNDQDPATVSIVADTTRGMCGKTGEDRKSVV
jgi:tetrahydromethanopterin S-methyltransferase subunit H